MSKTDHGTTEVKMGDDTYILKPTLKAVKAIEQRFGGISPAISALGSLNISALAMVIAIGAGLNYKPKDLEVIEEAIFEAGIREVNPQAVPYLVALLNPAGKSEEEIEAASAAGNE